MRRRFLLITAGAICIAFLITLLKWPPNFLNDSLARRKLLYQSPTGMLNNYKAPLYFCDSLTPTPNEYIVFLHFGYSLEEHKQTVSDGVDLDSAIKNIFPETRNYSLYYNAELPDASLAAVRADIGVDMVECNGEVYLIG